MRDADYFNLSLPEGELQQISMLGLAHIGDAVYELLVRSCILCEGKTTNTRLHSATVGYVSAGAQAAALERLLPELTEEERSVCRRGRNTRVNSIPKHADIAAYHAATALECLFGWLYLKGQKERINRLFALAMGAGEERPHEPSEKKGGEIA